MLSQTQTCNTGACVRHCQVTDWSPATFGPGDCSAICGNGTIPQTRTVLQQPQAGGTPCPDLARNTPCNTDPCPTHCVVNNWGDWGPCNKDCGDGVRARSRAVATPATFGGLSCPPLVQTSPCPGLQPCDYLAKLRNLKDRIRRLELQKRVEYLEHLHLLAKARQILFPNTGPPMSSSASGCPGGPGCDVHSSSAGAAVSSSALPPPPKPIVIKQPVVYIIDRPYAVDVPESSTLSPPPPPVVPSSSAAFCSDGNCVVADVVECCPGHCCAPPPKKDVVEAIAVDHLDNCCDHADPHISCCIVRSPDTCCHWPNPHESCCVVPRPSANFSPRVHRQQDDDDSVVVVPHSDPTQSCCHLLNPDVSCCSGRPPLHDDRRVIASADAVDSNYNGVYASVDDDSNQGNTCCDWPSPEPRCCAAFRQKKVMPSSLAGGDHVYPALTDTEQLESITDFLQVNESPFHKKSPRRKT